MTSTDPNRKPVPQNRLRRPAVYSALALAACALWGTAFPCIKLGYEWGEISGPASQILFAGIRFTIAGFMTWALGSIFAKKPLGLDRKAVLPVAGYGLLQTTLNYILFYIGMANLTGSRGSIINGTSAIFAIIAAWLLPPHERMGLRKIIGCALGFAGIVVVNIGGLAGGGDSQLYGTVLMIVCAAVQGVANIDLKKIGGCGSPFQITAFQLGIGGIILLTIGLVSGGQIGAWPAHFVWLLLYMSFLTTAAFTLWTLVMRENPVGRISVFMFSIPLFGVLFSALFLGEQVFTMENAVSLTLICAGIVLVNRDDPAMTEPE